MRTEDNFEHGIALQCAVGWRGWNLFNPHYLQSGNWIWPVKERLEAKCNHTEHRENETVPVVDCSCGIYAFKRPEQVREQNYNHQQVLGEVSLWGKVVECRDGWKAQYAYPRRLWVDGKSPMVRLAEYTAWTYGVPIEVVNKDEHVFWTQSRLSQNIPKPPRRLVRPLPLYDSQGGPGFGEVVYANVITMPKIPELEPPEEPIQPKVIDERSGACTLSQRWAKRRIEGIMKTTPPDTIRFMQVALDSLRRLAASIDATANDLRHLAQHYWKQGPFTDDTL